MTDAHGYEYGEVRQTPVGFRLMYVGAGRWINMYGSYQELPEAAVKMDVVEPASSLVEHHLVIPEAQDFLPYCTCGAVMPYGVKTSPSGWHFMHKLNAERRVDDA